MIRSHRGSAQDDKRYFKETYLVILVLIAAAAYQTALSPPGGYWQENKNSTSPPAAAPAPAPTADADADIDTPKTESHSAGTSIIGTRDDNDIGYGLFVISNSVAFHMSISMICWLTAEFPILWVLLLYSLLGILSTNYAACVILVIPPDRGYEFLRLFCYLIAAAFLILNLLILLVIKTCACLSKYKSPSALPT